MIIERGFSKDTLGLVLTLGIIPYVVMAEPLGRLARKYGTKVWMAAGFLSFAAFAVWAAFASGWWLMAIFVMWQISGALMEPVHDLLFFDAVKKDERSKYIGVFKTSGNIPRFIAPLLGTGAILIFGATSAVWGVAALIAMGSAFAVLRK
jgi:MFS family permease